MNRANEVIILVWSTSYAMHIERFLKKAAIPCSLIPVPRELSSNCGVCVRIDDSRKIEVETLLAREKIPHEGLVTRP